MKSTNRVFAHLLFALAMLPCAANADRIAEGTVDIGVSGMVDFDSIAGTDYKLELSGGYFVMNGVMVGGKLNFQDNDYITTYGASALVEQHFETGWLESSVVPYIRGSLGVYSSEVHDNSSTALVAGGAAGVKFFLTTYAALDLSMNVDVASDDIYLSDNGDAERVDAYLKLGIRILFR